MRDDPRQGVSVTRSAWLAFRALRLLRGATGERCKRAPRETFAIGVESAELRGCVRWGEP